MNLTRDDIKSHIGYAVDDAASQRSTADIPDPDDKVVYVGWQCGAEPMFVAVFSYLPNVRVNGMEAVELATDLLTELNWFDGEPTDPDFVL